MGSNQAGNSRGAGHVTGLTFWLLPASVIVLCSLLALGGESAFLTFRYDRDAIADGAAWRLVSGHLVHLSWGHFFLNMAGLGLVWLLVGRALGTVQWLLGTAFLVLVIDVGFWWLDPNLSWYVGLSGVLHGLLVAGLIAGWHDNPLENTLVLLLVTGKLTYEQWIGPLPGSESTAGGSVVVNAHLYGALAGAAFATLLRIRVRATPAI